MLNSDLVCSSAYINGNNSFNKRLKALEQAIASYSTAVASDKVKGNTGEFINAKVTDTATINKENVEQSNVQDLNAKHIDNRGGFSYLGATVVESLQVGDGNINAEYDDLTVKGTANISNAEVEEASISKATVTDLTVRNPVKDLNVAKLRVDGKYALSNSGFLLKMAEGFSNADFNSALRPSWNGKPFALTEDTSTVFRLMGIINNSTELPGEPENGDCYFLRTYSDGTTTGPAVAAYSNGEWGYVIYPGLDDYVTNTDFQTWEDNNYVPFVSEVRNYLSVFVPTADASEFVNNPEKFRILALYNALKAIEHQLYENAEGEEDGTWKDWRESVDNFIQTTFEEYKEEIANELSKKLEDPEENGQYLREIVDGVGQWTKLTENDVFVNKTYKEEDEVKGTIKNDGNGIQLESEYGVTASTPESSNETTKAVINQEYLRNNLSLSKSSTSSERSELHYEEKGVIPESEHVYITSTYGAENTWWAMKRYPYNWKVATKNYEYYRFFNYNSNEANTHTFFFSLDKKGTLKKVTQVLDGHMNMEAQASAHGSWLAYNPDAWNGETDDVAYYMFPRAFAGNIQDTAHLSGYINVYKDGDFYGRVKDADDNEFGIYTAVSNPNPSYYRWGGKTLRNSVTPRALVVNDSDNATDQLKAYLIGVDANGEEGIDKGKPVALPAKITWGPDGLAAGKNYFWFQNGWSNIFSRMDKDGNIASYTLVDPVEQTALSSSQLRNCSGNYIELENGDVIFYVANCQTGLGIDYFIYCSDDPTDAAPVKVFRSAVKFSHAESATDRWPLCARYPFVECGNYVYFFPSFCYSITDAANVMGYGDSVWWKSIANQYARLDKTSMSWSYTQFPWTIGNFASYGPAQHLITKDGYLWVFPNQISDTTINGSKCLVIAPNGQASTIDLGTGSSVNFFYADSNMNGWSCYLNQSGTASWSYSRQQNTLAGVNSHGLGCLVSPDFKHILLFKGNGEFKHYDYTNGTKGFFPQGISTYRGGPGLRPLKDGFLLSFYNTTGYRMASNPEAEAYGYIYISTKGDDVNEEPTFKYFSCEDGNGDFINYWEPYGYNMTYENYNRRFLTQKNNWMHHITVEAAVGLSLWKETKGTNEGTIYLKDGDYEISEVDV